MQSCGDGTEDLLGVITIPTGRSGLFRVARRRIQAVGGEMIYMKDAIQESQRAHSAETKAQCDQIGQKN